MVTKFKCVESFSVQACDGDGFSIENEEVQIEKGSLWEGNKDELKIGDMRLESYENGYRWIDGVDEELLNSCFKEIESN